MAAHHKTRCREIPRLRQPDGAATPAAGPEGRTLPHAGTPQECGLRLSRARRIPVRPAGRAEARPARFRRDAEPGECRGEPGRIRQRFRSPPARHGTSSRQPPPSSADRCFASRSSSARWTRGANRPGTQLAHPCRALSSRIQLCHRTLIPPPQPTDARDSSLLISSPCAPSMPSSSLGSTVLPGRTPHAGPTHASLGPLKKFVLQFRVG